MPTLTEAVLAADLQVSCDATQPGLYRIGDEMVRLREPVPPDVLHGAASGRWYTDRGLEGTTPADHDDGATVTPALDAYTSEASPFASGAEQTVTLLGPFHITYNQAGISDQVGLTALASGTSVIRAWARTTTTWDGTSPILIIGAGGSEAVSSGNYWTCTEYDLLGPPQEDSGAFAEATSTPAELGVVTLLEDGFLVASIGGTPTAGAADIYALIATPSA